MQNTNGMENITEYKIGNTTYYVETIFNPNLRAESLDELIERLIGKEIEKIAKGDQKDNRQDSKIYHFNVLNFF